VKILRWAIPIALMLSFGYASIVFRPASLQGWQSELWDGASLFIAILILSLTLPRRATNS
jgi:Na+-translocating ferredoxin:NAD+ oxidoreductase RnfD subunit